MFRAFRLRKLYCSTSLIFRYGAGEAGGAIMGVSPGVIPGVIVDVIWATVEITPGVAGAGSGSDGPLSLSMPSAATPARITRLSTMAVARANLGAPSPLAVFR